MHSTLSNSGPSVSAGQPQTFTFYEECQKTLALAFPLVSGQLSQMLMGAADTAMIGDTGVVPLGASTFANTLLAVPFVVGIGLLSSVSVRVSQALGAHQPEDAKEAVRHGTWLAVGLGLLVVAGMTALLPFLHLFRQPPEVVQHAPTYLITCAFSLIPALMSMVWKNHADALNHPWPPFYIMLGSVLLNIALNWVLIYGHLGFPAMGLEGAGYATLTARIVGAVVLFSWLLRDSKLGPWTPHRWLVPWQRQRFKHLLEIGIPASLHLLAEVTAFVMASLMVGSLGVAALAAHQVAITCVGTAFMIPLGVSMATTVRVGEIVGAGQRHRLHRVLAGSWLFAAAFMSCSMLTFFMCGRQLSLIFLKPEEAQVIEIAISLLLVASVFQLFDGLQVVSAAALRGVDDVKVPARIAILAYWIISLPLGWWFAYRLHWGAAGVWGALAVGLSLAAVMLMARAWRLLGSTAPVPKAAAA